MSRKDWLKEHDPDTTLVSCEVYRKELFWIYRRRAGLTQKQLPVSHLTCVRWENGRRWSELADDCMSWLAKRDGSPELV